MGKHIKANGFAETAKNNRLSWQLYFDRLLELSISMFEWQNVPDSIDTRFLEINLFDLGFCVFFKDEVHILIASARYRYHQNTFFVHCGGKLSCIGYRMGRLYGRYYTLCA